MLASEQVEAAVEWWAKAIQAPKFEAIAADERDPAMEMASMMAHMNVVPLADDYLPPFKDELRRVLTSFRPGIDTLGCDYDPDTQLARAARNAGIPTSNFPWKTMMRFEGGGVQVSCGYRAPVEELIDLKVE